MTAEKLSKSFIFVGDSEGTVFIKKSADGYLPDSKDVETLCSRVEVMIRKKEPNIDILRNLLDHISGGDRNILVRKLLSQTELEINCDKQNHKINDDPILSKNYQTVNAQSEMTGNSNDSVDCTKPGSDITENMEVIPEECIVIQESPEKIVSRDIDDNKDCVQNDQNNIRKRRVSKDFTEPVSNTFGNIEVDSEECIVIEDSPEKNGNRENYVEDCGKNSFGKLQNTKDSIQEETQQIVSKPSWIQDCTQAQLDESVGGQHEEEICTSKQSGKENCVQALFDQSSSRSPELSNTSISKQPDKDNCVQALLEKISSKSPDLVQELSDTITSNQPDSGQSLSDKCIGRQTAQEHNVLILSGKGSSSRSSDLVQKLSDTSIRKQPEQVACDQTLSAKCNGGEPAQEHNVLILSDKDLINISPDFVQEISSDSEEESQSVSSGDLINRIIDSELESQKQEPCQNNENIIIPTLDNNNVEDIAEEESLTFRLTNITNLLANPSAVAATENIANSTVDQTFIDPKDDSDDDIEIISDSFVSNLNARDQTSGSKLSRPGTSVQMCREQVLNINNTSNKNRIISGINSSDNIKSSNDRSDRHSSEPNAVIQGRNGVSLTRCNLTPATFLAPVKNDVLPNKDERLRIPPPTQLRIPPPTHQRIPPPAHQASRQRHAPLHTPVDLAVYLKPSRRDKIEYDRAATQEKLIDNQRKKISSESMRRSDLMISRMEQPSTSQTRRVEQIQQQQRAPVIVSTKSLGQDVTLEKVPTSAEARTPTSKGSNSPAEKYSSSLRKRKQKVIYCEPESISESSSEDEKEYVIEEAVPTKMKSKKRRKERIENTPLTESKSNFFRNVPWESSGDSSTDDEKDPKFDRRYPKKEKLPIENVLLPQSSYQNVYKVREREKMVNSSREFLTSETIKSENILNGAARHPATGDTGVDTESDGSWKETVEYYTSDE